MEGSTASKNAGQSGAAQEAAADAAAEPVATSALLPTPAVAISIHSSCVVSDSPATSHGPLFSKEVKLEELSKYFHLPEKAVAKELGICLTSLKKLCRSYGITRWPFRKLKSLERTMRKVQTESEVANGNDKGDKLTSTAAFPQSVGSSQPLADPELPWFTASYAWAL